MKYVLNDMPNGRYALPARRYIDLAAITFVELQVLGRVNEMKSIRCVETLVTDMRRIGLLVTPLANGSHPR